MQYVIFFVGGGGGTENTKAGLGGIYSLAMHKEFEVKEIFEIIFATYCSVSWIKIVIKVRPLL